MLVRRPPRPAAVASLVEALRRHALAEGSSLVFFHAEAVLWPDFLPPDRLPAGQLCLSLCSASWRRRRDGSPPPPFVLGSLVQFWQAADQTVDVFSLGVWGET